MIEKEHTEFADKNAMISSPDNAEDMISRHNSGGIPFVFVAIPRYFFENRLIYTEIYMQFILEGFVKSKPHRHFASYNGIDYLLEPFEFIFGRCAFGKRFKFTPRRIRTVIEKLKCSGVIIDTGKGSKNHFSIFLWNIEKLGLFTSKHKRLSKRQTRDQQKDQPIAKKRPTNNASSAAVGTEIENDRPTDSEKTTNEGPTSSLSNDHKPRTEIEDRRNHHPNPPQDISTEASNSGSTAVFNPYKCLIEISESILTIEDKRRLTQEYTEEQVSRALKWALSQKKINKTHMSAVIFAINNKLSPVEDPIKTLALKYNDILKTHGQPVLYSENANLIPQGFVKILCKKNKRSTKLDSESQLALVNHNKEELENALREVKNQIKATKQ